MSVDATIAMRREDLPILRSPFHVLGVSARDSRQRVVAAAEERSLALDAEACAKARTDLTNLRNRLTAELGWLPGVSPRRAHQLSETLVKDPAVVFGAEGLPSQAGANLMSSAVLALDSALPEDEWVRCIIAFAAAVQAISVDTVLADINEDRTVAGFSEVKSAEAVEEGLAERRREYRDCLRRALDCLPPQKLARVVADVAEMATGGGKSHPSALIDDMIDAYAVGVHGFLSREAANIDLLVERAREAAPSGMAAVEPYLDRLEKVVRNWHAIARPIQLVAGTKGTAHALSRDVAGAVRNLGIFLYNEHTMLQASQRIVRLLQAAFGSLPELAEQAYHDARALDALARKKANAEKAKPVHDLCAEALDEIASDPLAGEIEGRNLLDAGRKLIASLAHEGLDRAELSELEDSVAIAVLRCAIALGNRSNKWEAPIALLEEARGLAHDKEICGRIDSTLATARDNHRVFGNLKQVSSAPSLRTINGCGFMVYGNTDPDPGSGTYMTTYYFVLLFLPIFPIARYRVRSSGTGYSFFGKGPLRTFDKVHLALSLIGILMLFVFAR
jgi:hypothetical protein